MRAMTNPPATTAPSSRQLKAYQDALAGEKQAEQWVQRESKWPKFQPKDLAKIRTLLKQGQSLVDLWERSPVRLEGIQNTEEIIDLLFPGNPLLCCGREVTRCETKPREEWRGRLSDMQIIVPSTMAYPQGRTRIGRLSARSLENVGPRRFLIIEFDFTEDIDDMSPIDACAGLLLHLGGFAPLTLVVHSGNKSLHGWFYCQDAANSRIENFMKYAVSLGADPANWTRIQPTRMPDGLRNGGTRQTIYFFNPEVIR